MALMSPCTQECRLDPAGLACLGCGRTLDEIQHWISMGDEARRRVLAALPERRAAMLLAADPLAYWSQRAR
jgi:predicted Fe-S protein YdhL (DUF1289 family)